MADFAYTDLFAVFFNDFLHCFPLLFHIFYQLELCSAAVKIMVFSVDLEVSVAVQVIGKEAHTALKSHHNCTDGEHLKLTFGKSALCALNKALNVKLVKVNIKVRQPLTAIMVPVVSQTQKEQIEAVGLIGYHCGVAVNMKYDADGRGSGAYGIDVPMAMEKYFGLHNVKHRDGAIGFFTEGMIKRVDIFEHIIKLLYSIAKLAICVAIGILLALRP